jgi:uncharacterized protein YlxW (UPF0749 family)
MILSLIRDYDIYIITGLIGLSVLFLIILIINSVRISKLTRKYRKFMRGSKDKNIEEVIFELIKKVDEAQEKTDDVKALYNEVDNRLNKCIQKVSITRYKAFEDMGSAALSFSIAFLDSHDTGVILTGIYGRDECTTYAKPVDKGVPKYDLSDEEKHVLQDAMKRRINIK